MVKCKMKLLVLFLFLLFKILRGGGGGSQFRLSFRNVPHRFLSLHVLSTGCCLHQWLKLMSCGPLFSVRFRRGEVLHF